MRRGWKHGATAAFALAFALTSCQGGYPMAATRCDRWCRVTRASECGSGPAQCVATCEMALEGVKVCVEQWYALLTCLEAHESSILCGTEINIEECKTEQAKLNVCALLHPPSAPHNAE